MADSTLGSGVLGLTDKRATQGNLATPTTAKTNLVDVGAMRTRLAAINAAYYTAARLNEMTYNDMVWAIRQADDAAGI